MQTKYSKPVTLLRWSFKSLKIMADNDLGGDASAMVLNQLQCH